MMELLNPRILPENEQIGCRCGPECVNRDSQEAGKMHTITYVDRLAPIMAVNVNRLDVANGKISFTDATRRSASNGTMHW